MPEVAVRPMRPEDVAGAELVSFEALPGAMPMPGEPSDAHHARGRSRIAHLLDSDPRGAWVAEHDDRVVGLALALVREGIWGLSLFGVQPGFQAQGVGRRLLDASLACAVGTRGGIILSSTDPRAMRRYARAGFDLVPLVAAAGIVDRAALGESPASVREAGVEDVEQTAAVSREVRGASHAGDIPNMLDNGCSLLLAGEAGFAVHRAGTPRLLAARDEAAAADLLRACLLAGPPGATLSVDFISAGQDWAIEVVLDAGMALSPDGPLFVRGDLGPLRPYLPSGAFL